MYRLALIIISAFALLPSPAWAKDAKAAVWIVSQLSGDARVVRNGLQPAALKANVRLAPGDMVLTGTTGRATLVHGGDYIVLAPRSEMRLPPEAQPTGFTRVIQNLGTMLFKVQHTGVPHFAVDTPMLAAVVKGTTFTVVVDKDRSAVQVIQGVVQVTAVDGGMSRLVEGGRTVFVNRSEPTRLLDADSLTAAAPTSASVRITGSSSPSVAAIAALTDGLVRPDTSSPKAAPNVASATPAAATQPAEDVVGSILLPVTEPADDWDTTAVAVTEPVGDVGDTVLAPVTEPVTQVVDTVVTPVTDVVDTAVVPVADVVDAVVTPVTEPVADIVDTITTPVTDVVGTVLTPVTDVVDTVVTPVTDVVDTVLAPVTDVVDTVVTPVSGVVDTILTPVTDVVDTVVTPVTDVVDTVVTPVTDVVDTVVTPVTEPVTDIVDTITTPVTDVVDTVTAPVTDVIAPVTDVIDTVLPPLPLPLFGGH